VLGALDLRPLLADLSDPFDVADGWRMNAAPQIRHRFDVDGAQIDVALEIEDKIRASHGLEFNMGAETSDEADVVD